MKTQMKAQITRILFEPCFFMAPSGLGDGNFIPTEF
jgi:hypothetical protein